MGQWRIEGEEFSWKEEEEDEWMSGSGGGLEKGPESRTCRRGESFCSLSPFSCLFLWLIDYFLSLMEILTGE